MGVPIISAIRGGNSRRIHHDNTHKSPRYSQGEATGMYTAIHIHIRTPAISIELKNWLQAQLGS